MFNKSVSGLTDESTMMDIDSVNANFTTEPMGTSSNVNITNQIVETSIIPHHGCDNSSAFDHDSVSVSEEDCEVDVMDFETVGKYSML